MLGVELNNDPVMFKTYHYHMETGRNYSKQVIPSPYGYLIPESINFEDMKMFHPEYPIMIQYTNNFSKWNFVDDNNLIIKLCKLHISIQKPQLMLDALNVNLSSDSNSKKYFEACSGYFICEPYSIKIQHYQQFYQNMNVFKKKQQLWYKLQNTLINSYNTSNNWMNVYKDKRVLFITPDTMKQEMLYNQKDNHYSSVFSNKEQRFITWKYNDNDNNNENNVNGNITVLTNHVEKIRDSIDVVYIDVHGNVNNKIAYTIWKKEKTEFILYCLIDKILIYNTYPNYIIRLCT
jgi:hypothetical protein